MSDQERLAQDPNTPSETLAQLYDDFLLRKALAQNPNTSFSLLMQLASTYPREVLQNPSFELIFLEDPGNIRKFPDSALSALCEAYPLPGWFLMLLATSSLASRESLAARHDVTPELLVQFSTHPNAEVRRIAAISSKTPTETLRKLSKDPRRRFFPELAENPATPPEILHWLSTKKGSFFHSLCSNPNISVETLVSLSTHAEQHIRYQVLKNPKTPREILYLIFNAEENSSIRSGLVENPLAPPGLLARLSPDDAKNRYYLLAAHPNTPIEVLEGFFQEKNYHIHVSVAMHPKAPAYMLETIAAYADPLERIHVARNPNTPLPLIEKLSRDPFVDVRFEVARNVRAPLACLLTLRNDEDPHVRKAAADTISTQTRVGVSLPS